MSSRSEAPSTTPRVRPVTWVILAWMIITIAAIVGAWQGSESRYGAIPEITIATDRGRLDVLPYEAADLNQNSYTNPAGEFDLSKQETFSVHLPGELQTSALNIVEFRAEGENQYTVEPDGAGRIRIPVTTPDGGRIEGLVITATAYIYAEDGSEDFLSGEWTVKFTYQD